MSQEASRFRNVPNGAVVYDGSRGYPDNALISYNVAYGKGDGFIYLSTGWTARRNGAAQAENPDPSNGYGNNYGWGPLIGNPTAAGAQAWVHGLHWAEDDKQWFWLPGEAPSDYQPAGGGSSSNLMIHPLTPTLGTTGPGGLGNMSSFWAWVPHILRFIPDLFLTPPAPPKPSVNAAALGAIADDFTAQWMYQQALATSGLQASFIDAVAAGVQAKLDMGAQLAITPSMMTAQSLKPYIGPLMNGFNALRSLPKPPTAVADVRTNIAAGNAYLEALTNFARQADFIDSVSKVVDAFTITSN